MWIRTRQILLGSIASAAMLAGCGSSSTGPSPSALEGTWTVTKMEFVKGGSPTTKVDLIANGSTAILFMDSSNGYTLTVKTPEQADEVTTGTWSAASDVLTMTVDGMMGERQFQMSLSANTLTLSGADVDFDFNLDGVDEPAKLNMTLTK